MKISYGVRGGRLQEAIPRNTPIPCTSQYQAFRPSGNGITQLRLVLYEGDTNLSKEAYCIGSFDLSIGDEEEDNDEEEEAHIRFFQRVEVTSEEIRMYAVVRQESPRDDEVIPDEQKCIFKTNKPTNTDEDIKRLREVNLSLLQEEEKPEEIKYNAIATQNINAIKVAKNKWPISKESKSRIDEISNKIKDTIKKAGDGFNRDDFVKLMDEYENEIRKVYAEYERPPKFKYPESKA